MKTARPQLQAKLNDLLETAEADVETIRERTTPWADLVDAPGSANTTPDADAQSTVSGSTRGGFYNGGMGLKRIRSGDQRRLSKIERINDGVFDAHTEALALIERWGEEIVSSTGRAQADSTDVLSFRPDYSAQGAVGQRGISP
jgi:hypothetical protein